MGILSLLSGVLSAPNNIKKVAGAAVNAIDALHFSKEEQVEFISKIGQTVVDYAVQTANESSIRSMTRRAIAILFCVPFVGLIVFAAIIWKFDSQWAIHAFNCAKIFQNPVIAIILFFFGSYGVGYFFDKKNEKK